MGELLSFIKHDFDKEFTNEELLAVRQSFLSDYLLRENEYITNDFKLVCEKCKCEKLFQANDFLAVCRCKCECEELAKFEKQKALEKKMQRLRALKNASLLDEMFIDASFEKLDLNRPESFVVASKRCKTYCEKWDEVKSKGLGMYIYGDKGTGKSLLTACIGNYLLNRNVSVLFTSFLNIAKEIKRSFYNQGMSESEFIDRLAEVELLIIDDLGTEIYVKNGEITWIQTKIYDVINRRWLKKMPTIFSSNESLKELTEKCGLMDKTVDRIASMSTAKIELRGSSYRLKVNKENLIF